MSSRIPGAALVAKKTSSQPAQTYPARGHVSLFVRCLHLLDLDLLDDWPGVTEGIFNARVPQQNLQSRVKAVEWSLYRLFERYDAIETRDKLSPFFPPASPLQSLNLRAALYRCLTELKKNGILGAHVQLRKTMLDECKGDKFEEVIAGFAMIVLRKNKKQVGFVPKSGTADQLVPLLLAHRSALQATLLQHKELRGRHEQQKEQLDRARQELEARREELKARSLNLKPERNHEIERVVYTNWIGDQSWAHLLVNGRPSKPALSISGLSQESPAAVCDPVDLLDEKFRQHQARLAEWKVIAKDLGAKQKQTQPSATSKPPAQIRHASHLPSFTKHKQLQLSNPDIRTEKAVTLTPIYQDLMDAMGRELEAPMQQAVHHRAKPQQNVSSSISLKSRSGTMQNDIAPLDAYNPMSDRQRLPHELEPETARLASAEPLDVDNNTTQAREHASPIQSTENLVASLENLKVEDNTSPASSPVSSLPDDLTSSTWIPAPLSSATTLKPYSSPPIRRRSTPEVPDEEEDDMDLPASPSKEWMSLVERTRASMSNFNQYKQPLDDCTDAGKMEDISEDGTETVLPQVATGEDRRATLLERTRQSMSLMSAPPRASKRKSQMHKRLSQLFPVNQFETPGKPRRSSEFGPRSGSSTPRDKLFDDTADYASVFKSRPKLAQSPALSPDRSTVGFDSILEQDIEGLEFVSDDDAEDEDY